MNTEDLEIRFTEAVESGNVEEVRQLVASDPGLLRCDFAGDTALHHACHVGDLPMIKALVELGIDVNAKSEFRPFGTPLESSMRCDNPEIVRFLLDHGADPHHGRLVFGAIRGDGRRPTQRALEIIKLLEQHGTDLHRVFENELTNPPQPMNALSFAMDWGKQDVVDYLRSKGAVLPGEAPPPAASPNLHDEIVAFCTETFGPVEKRALIEIVPSEPAIAVHAIPATKERNHVTLFTVGMSDRPMTVPAGQEDYEWGEIFIQLPADWPYQHIDDPNHGWPNHWLLALAKHPHENQTWLGGPVGIIANDDPPQPLAPNTRFTSLLYLSEKSFTSKDGRNIRFYRMAPLYTEERELEIREGIGALLTAFDRNNIGFVVNMNRPSVA